MSSPDMPPKKLTLPDQGIDGVIREIRGVRALNWSQFATSSSKHRGKVYRPWAFTEHGALQAANILNSSQAVKMSLYVIRAFVKSRDELAANSAMVKRLAQIDNTLFLHDSALRDPWLAVALAKAALPKAASTSRSASRTATKAAHRLSPAEQNLREFSS